MPIYITLSYADTMKCKSVYLLAPIKESIYSVDIYFTSRFEIDLIEAGLISGLKWSCCFSYLSSAYATTPSVLTISTILLIMGQKNTMKSL